MEKRKPHAPLSSVKALIGAGKVRATFSAMSGAAQIGLDLEAMIEVVMTLKPADFYKSMTTYKDAAVWQDVYRPKIGPDEVYVKLTIMDGVVIVSFKAWT